MYKNEVTDGRGQFIDGSAVGQDVDATRELAHRRREREGEEEDRKLSHLKYGERGRGRIMRT